MSWRYGWPIFLQKWTKGCKTVEDIRDVLVQEKLLSSLPMHRCSDPCLGEEAKDVLEKRRSLRTVICVHARRRGSEMSRPLMDHGKKQWSRDQKVYSEREGL